jgi:hypothetical protein
MQTPLSLLALAYVAANVCCVIAYIPQIRHVWCHAEARRQVILATWWMWTFGGLTEWAYAASLPHTLWWQLIAAMHALASGVVAVLGSTERLKHWWAARALQRVPPPLTHPLSRPTV